MLLLGWVMNVNIVEVFFEYNKSSSFFRNDGLVLKLNVTVLVNTERGIQFGKVIKIFDDVASFGDVDLGNVIRISTKKDYFQHLENLRLNEEALIKCKEIVKNSNINMTI